MMNIASRVRPGKQSVWIVTIDRRRRELERYSIKRRAGPNHRVLDSRSSSLQQDCHADVIHDRPHLPSTTTENSMPRN
ncbi:MAG: hypothetical protein M3Y93_04215, partial [Pseudomonadota bacterium]|nr:hypothetical protein [Pseudomonadota bacterium]